MMIQKILVMQSDSYDPHYNQAIEAGLMDFLDDETVILYLWINDKTVFIGRNQDAYREVNFSALTEDGVKLARRLSGGGAVYHDKKNLNFTFYATRKNYSVAENYEIILSAVKKFGINAELSGRNDCLIEGRKFSGSAYYNYDERCFHHGTLIVSSDIGEFDRYLTPSKVKLESKGVKSVASRITSLSEHSSLITLPLLSEAIIRSFCSHYQRKLSFARVEELVKRDLNKHRFNKALRMFSSETYARGFSFPCQFKISESFAWGHADILIETRPEYCGTSDKLSFDEGGREDEILQLEIYSDTLRVGYISRLKECLKGQNLLAETHVVDTEDLELNKDTLQILKSLKKQYQALGLHQ